MTDSTKYLLAVDGGGTKTDALCADINGQVLGEGSSGATSLTATSLGAAGFSLRESIRQATEHLPEGAVISCMVMGLAGMDTPKEKTTAEQQFQIVADQFAVQKFILVNDIEVALASGSDKANAIALISGTGSHCFGRNQAGETAKVGGMDFLLTDQGSGYAIGRRVLREAVKSFDGRSSKSQLEFLVQEYFQLASVAELKDKVYNPLLSKANIAAVAKLCFTANEAGDAVAQQILLDAVSQLIIMVRAAISRLDLQSVPTDLVIAGSIITQDFMLTNFKQRLQQEFPQLNIVTPQQEPVYGALKLAQQYCLQQPKVD